MAQQAAMPPDPESTITGFNDFWINEGREQSRPIDVEMIVTYYDPPWGNLWGEINGVPGFFRVEKRLPIRSYDRVRIKGTVVPAKGLTEETATFTVLEHDTSVEVLDAAGRLAEHERFRSRVVTLEGIVDIEKLAEGNHYSLDLVADGHRVLLYHWNEEPRLRNLPEGTVVRVTGVYTPRIDPRTEVVEVDIWVGRDSDIVPIGNLDTDARFDVALSSIEEVHDIDLEGRQVARVAGVVHAYVPGEVLTLRDATGQINVQCLQTMRFDPGEVVEAVGNPFTGGADWLLRRAVVRRAGPEVARDVVARLATAPQLRLADEVLALSPEQAAEARPVDLTGIAVWASPDVDFLFLRDTSGGVRVNFGDVSHDLVKTGAGIRVRGLTTSGAFTPEIEVTAWEYWGGAVLPPAKDITLEQAMTGREEGQRIELQGLVTHVAQDLHWTRLVVSTGTGEFTAFVNDDDGRGTYPEGSIISVRGVCRAVANARRQLIGIEVWVPTAGDVRTIQAAPADPFAAPLRRISALRQFNPNSSLNYWTRIRGSVIHQVPGRYLFLQDGTEGLMVLTPQDEPLQPGDAVEVSGLPGFESGRVLLREAVYRRIESGEEPSAAILDEAGVVNEELESRLVRVDATLVSAIPDGRQVKLALQTGDTMFSAALPRPAGSRREDLIPGSRLQLTGVYQVDWDERRRARGFQLQLRSDDDVVVLRRPSWLTPGRALAVSGMLGACVLFGLGWVGSLRRRVRQQTGQIRSQVAREAQLEARHRDIIQKASDFIFTTDRDGRFTSFNPAGERITGYTRDEALQMHLPELIVPEDSEDGPMRALAAGRQESISLQSRLRRRDGRIIWTETNARLIHDDGGSSGILGVVRDISERKQIEEELKRAKEAAEANTQAKSMFLANMSHEIRTPMNGVIGMSHQLLDTPLREDQREFAETIRNSAESLLTVLNDILDFSKIEAGKMHFEAVDFDLEETVEDALDLLGARAAGKGLELAAFVPLEVPRRVRGDPGRLRQVLLNLLDNAVKFTERGEVVVGLDLLDSGEGRVKIRFEVRDTGIGMNEDARKRLFQPFSQADSSTTRRFGGTGLGLAISRQIVGMMDGNIGVESEPGVGSTFWFEIWLERQDTANDPGRTLPLDGVSGLRVLAVDDHGTNRRLIHFYATGWNMRCDTVDSGPEALEAVRRAVASGDPYRLILLDLHMPEMDGMMLARALTRDRPANRVPMLLLTSVDRRFDPAEMAEIGIGSVLHKPIRQRELLRAVLRVAQPGKAAAVEAATARSTGANSAGDPGDMRGEPLGLRVLIAEDNAVNQRLTELQLKKLGCVSDVAANGIEALDALERARYDAVLMDCQMPEMDGYEATRVLRRSGRHPGLRVIAMTANAMEGDREKCLAAGMDDYLSKPTRADDLRAVLIRSIVRTPAAP